MKVTVGHVMDKIKEIKRTDDNFPVQLRHISGCPERLFVRGQIKSLTQQPLIAVVGTRRMTNYCEAVIRRFVPTWVRHGIGIVSGLALGTDALVHLATLEANGLTIGILGSGVDQKSVTPRTNSRLAERIISSGGALASEYPDGTQPQPYHFPARNRIVAGLTLATVVIEAPIKSGALITAKFALDFGQEVFAVPGPITVETSRGTNWLIAQGAHPLLEPEDLLEVLGIEKIPTRQILPPNVQDGRLLNIVRLGSTTPDELAERSGLDIGQVLVALSELEVAGLVSRTGDKFTAN